MRSEMQIPPPIVVGMTILRGRIGGKKKQCEKERFTLFWTRAEVWVWSVSGCELQIWGAMLPTVHS
jgi:hypothetical protein